MVRPYISLSHNCLSDSSYLFMQDAFVVKSVHEISTGANVPSGLIIAYNGSANSIPDGWALCDGKNGTPNLCDRFIVGVNASYPLGSTGGAETVSLNSSHLPSHSHSFDVSSSAVYVGRVNTTTRTVWQAGNYDSTIEALLDIDNTYDSFIIDSYTGSTGNGSPHQNMPQYYALCFIMKL